MYFQPTKIKLFSFKTVGPVVGVVLYLNITILFVCKCKQNKINDKENKELFLYIAMQFKKNAQGCRYVQDFQ